jgi:hypothetical protein
MQTVTPNNTLSLRVLETLPIGVRDARSGKESDEDKSG